MDRSGIGRAARFARTHQLPRSVILDDYEVRKFGKVVFDVSIDFSFVVFDSASDDWTDTTIRGLTR